jgi:translation initiation factor 1A
MLYYMVLSSSIHPREAIEQGRLLFRRVSFSFSYILSLSLLDYHYHYVGQEYAQVVKMLGNGRCECFCFDGVTRLGHIRGKMRKKVWITAGDIILAAKRDFQDEKVDIVHKYSADEARNLKQYGELPENARINETAVDMAMAGNDDDDDIGIAFDDI